MFARSSQMPEQGTPEELEWALGKITNAQIRAFNERYDGQAIEDIELSTNNSSLSVMATEAWKTIIEQLKTNCFLTNLLQLWDNDQFPEALDFDLTKSLCLFSPKPKELKEKLDEAGAAIDGEQSLQLGFGIAFTALGTFLFGGCALAAAVTIAKGAAAALLTSTFLWPMMIGLSLLIVGLYLLHADYKADNRPVLSRC